MLVQVSGNSGQCAEDAMLLQRCLAQDSVEKGACQAYLESLCACLADACTPQKTDHQQDMPQAYIKSYNIYKEHMSILWEHCITLYGTSHVIDASA